MATRFTQTKRSSAMVQTIAGRTSKSVCTKAVRKTLSSTVKRSAGHGVR